MAVAGIACTLLRAMVTTSHARRGINKLTPSPARGGLGWGAVTGIFRQKNAAVRYFLSFPYFFLLYRNKRKKYGAGFGAALAPIQNTYAKPLSFTPSTRLYYVARMNKQRKLKGNING